MTRLIKLVTQNIDAVLKDTARILRGGGLVVFPSDTVYGLLTDATKREAVQKLIQFKNRAPGKAISIFIQDLSHAADHVKIHTKQRPMLASLLPGPFTVVLPSKHTVDPLLESEKGTLGIRIPNFLPILKLVQIFDAPITATSANLGGKHPYYSVSSLMSQLPKSKKDLIDLIVDAGKLPRNKPSTVIDLSESKVRILRKGDIVVEKRNKYLSHSPVETRKIGCYLIDKILKQKQNKPIIIILKGDLGSGKTEMTRGIAEYFGITNIISPTFVVYYEYKIKAHNFDTFIHADLYSIDDDEEFEQLGLEDFLKTGNVMVVEWGERLGRILQSFQKKAGIVFVEIKYDGEKKRQIYVSN